MQPSPRCVSSIDTPDIPAVSRDVKDDKVLAAAKAAQASYVVSEDRDLLDLGEYEGIKIITAREYLTLLQDAGHSPAIFCR